jgi:hypothetical protein
MVSGLLWHLQLEVVVTERSHTDIYGRGRG